jgi:hypothetical protein
MKHRTSHGTIPYLLEEVEIELHAGGKQIAVAFQREIPVTVDFSYIPGWPAITNRDPMECEEGAGPEIEIISVMPTLQAFIEVTDEDEKVQAALVLDVGRSLLWMLTDDQIESIEAAIEKYMTEGEDL